MIKWNLQRVLISAALLVALPACEDNRKSLPHVSGENAMEQTAERSAIEKLLFSYRDALNSSDVSKVLALYTSDGVFMPSSAPTAVGQAQIQAAYEYVFTQIQLNIEFYIDEVVVNADIAIARTMSKGTTLIRATGQTVEEENRELFVIQRSGGQWKIGRYMFNKMK